VLIRSARGLAIEQAILACARAAVRAPGFNLTKAKEAAQRIDRALDGTGQMESVMALAVVFLKAIGAPIPADDARLRTQ
jgi:hypothetical protein